MDCSPPGSSVHGILQAKRLEWAAIFSSGDLPDPGIKSMSPVSPALQADSSPAKPSGKPLEDVILINTADSENNDPVSTAFDPQHLT